MSIIILLIFFVFGVLLGYGIFWATARATHGTIIVTEDENGSKTFMLDFGDIDPYFLDQKKMVKLDITTSRPKPQPKPQMPKPPKSYRPSQDKHGL